jgi:hypothetical protein
VTTAPKPPAPVAPLDAVALGMPRGPVVATATPTSRRGCNARCARCGRAFDCGAGDAAPCACATIALTPAHRGAIADRYTDCLCLSCLGAIAQGAAP